MLAAIVIDFTSSESNGNVYVLLETYMTLQLALTTCYLENPIILKNSLPIP